MINVCRVLTQKQCSLLARSTTHRRAFCVTLLSVGGLLAGCSSLPPLYDAGPSQAMMQQAATGRIVADSGELMGAMRAPIDVGLARMGSDTALDRHRVIFEAVSQVTARAGNDAHILVDGPAAWEAIFTALRSARETIHIESFIFEDLDFSVRLSEVLIERQLAGVAVRVIYDSFGSLATPREFLDRLHANGVALCEFNPINPLRARLWRPNHRDHRKIVVVDGRIAFTGGINFHSVYRSGSSMRMSASKSALEEGWRDTHAELRGSAVDELQQLFLANWKKQSCGSIAPSLVSPKVKNMGPHDVAIIGSSPDGMPSRMYLLLAAAITYSRESVWLTSAYFAPDENTINALKAAARRGVDVRLLLPGITDSDAALRAGHSHYADLLAAGVRIFERHDALLHAKTAVIDSVWTTIGSSNLDWRSFCQNDEVNAVFLGVDFGQQMRAVFEADLVVADEIKLEQWQKRPQSARAKEWLARQFDRFL